MAKTKKKTNEEIISAKLRQEQIISSINRKYAASVPEVTAKKKGNYISKENEQKILEMIADKIEISKISDELNLTEASINNFIKKEEEQKISVGEYKKINTRGNVVECTLVSKRHDPVSGVKLNVFETFDTKLMFDYSKQEEIMKEFIDKNFTFKNGKSEQILKIFCTGIQCALGSALKVCFERNVPVILMHWNNMTCRYVSQEITGKIENVIEPNPVLRYFTDLYTINPNDVINLKKHDTFYLITVVYNNQKTNVIFIDEDEAWLEYRKILGKLKKSNAEITLFEGEINEDSINKTEICCKK